MRCCSSSWACAIPLTTAVLKVLVRRRLHLAGLPRRWSGSRSMRVDNVCREPLTLRRKKWCVTRDARRCCQCHYRVVRITQETCVSPCAVRPETINIILFSLLLALSRHDKPRPVFSIFLFLLLKSRTFVFLTTGNPRLGWLTLLLAP